MATSEFTSFTESFEYGLSDNDNHVLLSPTFADAVNDLGLFDFELDLPDITEDVIDDSCISSSESDTDVDVETVEDVVGSSALIARNCSSPLHSARTTPLPSLAAKKERRARKSSQNRVDMENLLNDLVGWDNVYPDVTTDSLIELQAVPQEPLVGIAALPYDEPTAVKPLDEVSVMLPLMSNQTLTATIDPNEDFSQFETSGIEAEDIDSLMQQFEGVTSSTSKLLQMSPFRSPIKQKAARPRPLTLDDYRKLRASNPAPNQTRPESAALSLKFDYVVPEADLPSSLPHIPLPGMPSNTDSNVLDTPKRSCRLSFDDENTPLLLRLPLDELEKQLANQQSDEANFKLAVSNSSSTNGQPIGDDLSNQQPTVVMMTNQTYTEETVLVNEESIDITPVEEVVINAYDHDYCLPPSMNGVICPKILSIPEMSTPSSSEPSNVSSPTPQNIVSISQKRGTNQHRNYKAELETLLHRLPEYTSKNLNRHKVNVPSSLLTPSTSGSTTPGSATPGSTSGMTPSDFAHSPGGAAVSSKLSTNSCVKTSSHGPSTDSQRVIFTKLVGGGCIEISQQYIKPKPPTKPHFVNTFTPVSNHTKLIKPEPPSKTTSHETKDPSSIPPPSNATHSKPRVIERRGSAPVARMSAPQTTLISLLREKSELSSRAAASRLDVSRRRSTPSTKDRESIEVTARQFRASSSGSDFTTASSESDHRPRHKRMKRKRVNSSHIRDVKRHRDSRSHDRRSRHRCYSSSSSSTQSSSSDRHSVSDSEDNIAQKHEAAMADRRVVYVGNLPKKYTRSDLKKRFGGFGEIERTSIFERSHEIGERYGFVTFYSKGDAYAAIEKGNDTFGPKFNLGFGGRRMFCDTQYADLDGCQAVREEWSAGTSSHNRVGNDFDHLLKNAMKKIR